MTAAIGEAPVLGTDADPRWFAPLLVWRAIVAVALATLTLGAVVQRGLVLDGPIRWVLVAALAGATAAAVMALLWTRRRDHRGRVTGFALDGLIGVIAAFIALNRMDIFTGLDAVGDEFNGSASWLLLIVLGWLVSGFADRTGTNAEFVKTAARYTMLVGLAVLLLTMNLLAGILEFVQRAVGTEVIAFTAVAIVAFTFTKILWGDRAAALFNTNQSQAETLEGLLFVAPNALGFLTFFAGPLVVSLFISFTEWDGLTDAVFVGF